jgi:dTDP-4-amino-4,6-dideoxygalactose transaminase
MAQVPWWFTELGDPEQRQLAAAFAARSISCGPVTRRLEDAISETLEVPHVVLSPSGTAALTMALLAHEVGPGDEVIVPDLTWIATAQAAAVLGATVIAADCLPEQPLIDPDDVTRRMSERTRAIIAVHSNGRGCDLERLRQIADGGGAVLVEDACKAFASRSREGFLGTLADVGCFSLGMVSMVSIGYGGCAVTRDEAVAERLRLIRDHGTLRGEPDRYQHLGFNFKVSDLLAAVGIGQLSRLDGKIDRLRAIYRRYEEGLRDRADLELIPVDVDGGELPLLIDLRSSRADELVNHLAEHGIEALRFHPPVHEAGYVGGSGDYPNASRFAREGCNLPCGPGQPFANIDRCLEVLDSWRPPTTPERR